MRIVSARTAIADLDALIEEVAIHQEAVCIRGNGHNAILLSEEYWRGMQETLSLLAVPGMRQSILDGMDAPLECCSEKL